ncbi:DUF6199 family natural product biosynthesis protein [Paenibacillus caseinilyticus]|uniref:DUF6199 domain-containing protein n=1 Tax=Paenibacillus mucilaginosus K02 TaxID=997761 RepID=I0BE49_9BACL|nr:hypothetical protein [Paenibacillus mucilaginosus]AFH60646.1 hypothetical protein B2K_07920 [Paenibacillus mucilaginosus K02]
MAAILVLSLVVFIFIGTGIFALIAPHIAWKYGFETSFKVRDPNKIDILITKFVGVVSIIIGVVLAVYFYIVI